jgi:glutamate formiminotransferase/glutamate formiminotransferase/formiminotetrahydrofolate cyclodeaminase
MNLIECVPNFSTSRGEVVEALTDAARSVPGAALLDFTSDCDHNRTVLTIAGQPARVAECAFRAIAAAVRLIHMPTHQGVHPRMGAADVVPFVPVAGVSLDECAAIAAAVAERVWSELRVPVFLYEAAARDPSRARLELLRSPSFTGEPDFGQGRHPTAGAGIVGARRFLIAWNINLASRDLAAARAIARSIRESSGGLPGVKALGLELKSRGQVQVSVNLTDFTTTPLHIVFDRVLEEASLRGIPIVGTELIGLIPRRALDLSAGHDLRWLVPRIQDYVLESRLAAAKL